MRRTIGRLTITGVVLAGVIGPGGPASAGTASTITADDPRHTITYTAGSGQANTFVVAAVVVTGTTWTYTVRDVAPITPGTGCSRPDPGDPRTATCVLTEAGDFYVQMQVRLGDGVDRIDFSAVTAPRGIGGYASVEGGPGDDVLVATAAEYLYGGDGDDTLVNGLVRGGNGDDTILNADDGLGEAGDDVITGTGDLERGDRLLGGPGDDRISGGAGPDVAYGNSGDDRIAGGPGNDELYGGPGDDTIHGNSGDDHLEGGPGRDRLSGGPGRDTVR